MEPLGIEGILTQTGVQEGFDGAGRGMDAVVGQLPVLQCDQIGANVMGIAQKYGGTVRVDD
jgi:hypothetical protein